LAALALEPVVAQDSWEGMGPSTRRTGMVISEIHYNPPNRADGRNLEFIEIANTLPWSEDIGGWRLSGAIDFTFPAGAEIPGRGYVVVAKVPADLAAVTGLSGIFGGFSGSLPNEGGTVRLRKPGGAVVLEVGWNDRAPWPVAADGAGHSLVLVRPSYGEASARAWACSPSVGGSPGGGDSEPTAALDRVAINELLARSTLPDVDFIELRNDGPAPVDLGGCTLSDDAAALGAFVIPEGTVLAPGGVLAFTEAQLGFALSGAGEAVFLAGPGGTRVLDAVRFDGSAVGVTLGRAHDRPGPLRELTTATPGSPNGGLRRPEVLVSEIYFDPISDDDRDEWLELHNPGSSAMDVGGWRFTDGISFTLPAGTSLPPGGWLVVAKDAARTRANHPGLASATVVGDYAGTLSNNGERLTLVRPETSGTETIDVVVDSVSYRSGGRWSRWAAGGGSSLEVVDLRADRELPGNWADSDESGKAPWTTVSVTGLLDLGHSSFSGADRAQFFLMGEGEVLVDEVAVVPDGGANILVNGGFEVGLGAWRPQGNQSRSSVVEGTGVDGGRALHLRASDRGEPDGNRVYLPFTPRLASNSRATVSARVRWLRGHPEFLLRLKGGFLETLTRLQVPTNLGTPGGPNSRAAANGGPAITEVIHRPLLPPTNTPIRVSARLSDPDGIGKATVHWRVQPSTTFNTSPMRDDGLDGDVVASDGVFTGTIPGQLSGALVVFRVEAEDVAATPVASLFPPDAPAHECLVRVNDPAQAGAFGNYRIWMTTPNVSAWTNREKFGNEPVDATFIYGGVRAVYGAGAWYAGSEASTPGYGSPVNGPLCGYNLIVPPDDTVLAEDHFTLDLPIRDSTNQREQLMFWMADRLGLPSLYRRYVHLFVNGTRRGVIYDDVQQPDQTLINEYFPDDNDGPLHKSNNWNEGVDNANSTSPPVDNLLRHYTSGGERKLARYRWNWRPRASRTSNDFADLFTLIDAVNAPSASLRASVEAVVDVENWMRTFAFHDLCSYWDSFGNPNHKNTYLYKPPTGRWIQFTWDMDVGLGVFNDPVDAALFPTTVDARVDALQAVPAFRRIYWRTMHEALATFFSGPAVTPLLQKKYATFAPNGVNLASPFVPGGAYNLSVPEWINRRRTFLQGQLNTVSAAFALTSPAETSVDTPSVTLTGTAPVEVETLTVNGVVVPVTWTTVTQWRITLTPAPGTHPYDVRAVDYTGAETGRATATVTFTGTSAWPPLRLNEWMAANAGSVTDPADGRSDDWLELYNPTDTAVLLQGWRLCDSAPSPTEFVFPAGYALAPGGRLLAWCDAETAQSQPPDSLHLPFRLAAEGETLTLTAPDGTVVDQVTFGPQVADTSQGRTPDGSTVIDFLAEPSAGTTNTSSLPPPQATGVTMAGDAVVVTVAATPGFVYQLQTKASLTDAVWLDDGPPVLAAARTVTLTASPAQSPDRFFRVVRQP
jgi:hypothetical protein